MRIDVLETGAGNIVTGLGGSYTVGTGAVDFTAT